MKEEIKKLVEKCERRAKPCLPNSDEPSDYLNATEAARDVRSLCAAIRETDAEREKERAVLQRLIVSHEKIERLSSEGEIGKSLGRAIDEFEALIGEARWLF